MFQVEVLSLTGTWFKVHTCGNEHAAEVFAVKRNEGAHGATVRVVDQIGVLYTLNKKARR